MSAIDKTYVSTWEDYKEARDWAISVGTVIDDYGNELCPFDWFYDDDLTEDRFKNNIEFVLWNTETIKDIWLIRNCPLKIVQDRLKEQYSQDYINSVLNRTTVFDTFVREDNKDPHFSINWKYNFPCKRDELKWWITPLSKSFKNGSTPYYYNDDTWHFPEEGILYGQAVCTHMNLGCFSKRKLYRLIRNWNLPKGQYHITIDRRYPDNKWYIEKMFIVTVK